MGIASERSMFTAGLAGASSTTSCAAASMRGDDDDIPRVGAKGRRGRGRGRGERGRRWGVERQRVWPCVGRGQRAFHTPLWSRLWFLRAASWGLSHCSGRSRGVRDDEPSVEHLEADGFRSSREAKPKDIILRVLYAGPSCTMLGGRLRGYILRAGKWRPVGCCPKAGNRSASDVLDTQQRTPKRDG